MDVIIVGAGMGGLSAAIGLAARGARVTLCEQNERVGGKLNVWVKDGFTFDTGPHVLTMRWALDEVFCAAGRTLDEFVSPVRLPVVCRYHFPNGGVFDAPADRDAAVQAVADFAPSDRDGFVRFLDYARRVSDATTEPFLHRDFGASVRGVPTPAQWRDMGRFLALTPWRSLRTVVQECFTDPCLRQIFELYALYSGSHPARVSGIFATVADVQWRDGTYYVPGGLYRLAEALRTVAEDMGVTIRTSTPVTEVIVKHGRARGVVTHTGERLFADAVVVNADCLHALQTLVPANARRRWTDKRVDHLEPSTSAFLLLLGVRGQYDQLAHHNSFLATDADAEYAAIFDARRPADDPTIGVACQSVTDPTKAPPGCSNLFVMTNPPALGPPSPPILGGGNSTASNRFTRPNRANAEQEQGFVDSFPQTWGAGGANLYRELVLSKLERMGLTGLRERILVEQVWTPLDLQSRYGAHRGAIYGLSSNGARQAFVRPPQKSPDVRGLYFVGGSTHPGGGLPLCALSGTNVAKLIAHNMEPRTEVPG